MNTTITQQEGRIVVGLIGRLDTAASQQADKDLAPVFYHTDCDILIDCSQLTYIASSGLRLMLSMYKHARKNGHRALITGANADVTDVFRISGFMQLFDVEEENSEEKPQEESGAE